MSVEKHFNFGVEGRDYYLNNISFEPSTRLKYDLSTIEIDLGRQKGHTTFISKNAKPGDIIIIHTNLMIQHVKRNFYIDPNIRINTPNEFINNYRRFRGIDSNCIIWIDNWEIINKINYDSFDIILYNLFCSGNVNLIVKLG